MNDVAPSGEPARLAHVLGITALLSLCNGVYWHGISFIARHNFGFDEIRAELLYLFLGASYAITAFGAGRLSRWAGRHVSPRAQLGVVIAGAGVAAILPAFGHAELWLWVSAGLMNISTAVAWPLVEAFLTRGRLGPAMRGAVAGFNSTWMLTVALALMAVGPAIDGHLHESLLVLGAVTVPAFVLSRRLPAQLAAHLSHDDSEHVTPLYPALLRSTRILLPLGYTFVAAISPLIPFRLEELAVPLHFATAASATWMVTRWVAAVVLARWRGWHGRAWPLWAGTAATCFGVAGVLLAPSLAGLLAGFSLFGLGLGVLYHLSLYYSMAVGDGDVDAGGTFEALVGLGYTTGPVLALGAGMIGGKPVLASGLGVLAVVGLLYTGREILSRRGAVAH